MQVIEDLLIKSHKGKSIYRLLIRNAIIVLCNYSVLRAALYLSRSVTLLTMF